MDWVREFHLGDEVILPLHLTPEVKYSTAPILPHKFGQKFICNADIWARYQVDSTNKHRIGFSVTPGF